MLDYEIWLVDKYYCISATHRIHARDDAAAIEVALSLGPARMIQVWRGAIYVRGIHKGALPLDEIWASLPASCKSSG